MPAIANIVVKKNDNTTDVTYVMKSPAGGEGSPASWRCDAHAAPYSGFKPELRMLAKWNGQKTARRINVDFTYKVFATDSTTGIASVQATIPMTLTMAIPQSVSQAEIDEAVSQGTNLMVSSLIRTACKEGFAPT